MSLLILFAGCGDLGGGTATPEADDGTPEPDDGAPEAGDDTPTPTDEPAAPGTPTPTDEPVTTEPAGGATATATPTGTAALPTYEFSEGESYTYDAAFGDTTTTETWSVVSVDGDEVTVERTTTADGETETTTVTGTHSSIHDAVAGERNVNFFLVARGAAGYAQQGDLTAGNSFTVQSNNEDADWETATVEVDGETTVNGVTCTEFTVSPDGLDQVQTICLADDYPFAVSVSFTQGGQTVLEMTLTESNRP